MQLVQVTIFLLTELVRFDIFLNNYIIVNIIELYDTSRTGCKFMLKSK